MSQTSTDNRISHASTLARILREYHQICAEKNPYWTAKPLREDDPFEWHFTIRGPLGTEFADGLYHGKFDLPENYPLRRPTVCLLTQNGRFEIGKKVCMSASSCHPELWQPEWGIKVFLNALHVFFATPADGSLNSLDWPEQTRRKLAVKSKDWQCPLCNKTNEELIQEYCTPCTTEPPLLPLAMVPSGLAMRCKYLKTETPSIASHEVDLSTSAPSNSDDLEERRRRRRTQPTSLTPMAQIVPVIFKSVMAIFPTLIDYWCKLSVIDAAILVLDRLSLVCIFTIIILGLSLIRRPSPLLCAFMMDKVI